MIKVDSFPSEISESQAAFEIALKALLIVENVVGNDDSRVLLLELCHLFLA